MSTKTIVIGSVILGTVFAVGFVTALRMGAAKPSGAAAGKVTIVTDASQATFDYMVPADTKDWQMSSQSAVFDKTKGVVTYVVHSKADNTDVTISQQPMPAPLKSQKSSAFTQFIASSNVVASQPVGAGNLYYRAMQTIGGSANGAVTVIYMTPKALIFGAAGSPLSRAAWAQLMGSMQLK